LIARKQTEPGEVMPFKIALLDRNRKQKSRK
jgi:hypothetical protein